MKLGMIVGHVPREFSGRFWLEVVEEYLMKTVEEGSTKFRVCMYTITGRKKMIMKLEMLRVKNGRSSTHKLKDKCIFVVSIIIMP